MPTTPLTPTMSPRHWLTSDWGTRRVQRMRRLGEWVAMTRARLGLTRMQLQSQARRDGEELSETLILRLENLRLADNPTDERRRISLTAVDYLAALAGLTLADLDAYLRTGEMAALEPSLESRADSVRSVFLRMRSPVHQQSLEDFAEHLYQRDLAEASAEYLASHAASAQGHPSAGRRMVGTVDAETEATRATLREVGEGAIDALLTAPDELTPPARGSRPRQAK